MNKLEKIIDENLHYLLNNGEYSYKNIEELKKLPEYNMIKTIALVFAKHILEEAAENAITFIPSHNHLHSIKAVNKGSITSVLDKYL